MVVVFPAPLGPRNPNTVPEGISRSSPSTARTLPNVRVNPSVRMIAGADMTHHDTCTWDRRDSGLGIRPSTRALTDRSLRVRRSGAGRRCASDTRRTALACRRRLGYVAQTSPWRLHARPPGVGVHPAFRLRRATPHRPPLPHRGPRPRGRQAEGPTRHSVPAEPLLAAGPGVHRRAPVPRVPVAPARGRAPGQPDRVRVHRPALRVPHPAEPGAQRRGRPRSHPPGAAGDRRRPEGRREHPALPGRPSEAPVPGGHRQRERRRNAGEGGP